MNRESEKLMFALALAAAAGIAANFLAGHWFGARTPAAVQPFVATVAVAALLAGGRERLARRAAEEARKRLEAGKAKSSSIFTEAESWAQRPAQAALQRYEVAAQPLFFALAALVQCGGAWLALSAAAAAAGRPSGYAGAAALTAVEAFVFFLAARWLSAGEPLEADAWVRSPAKHASVAAFAAFAAAVAALLAAMSWAAAERWCAILLAACAFVMGLESALRLVAEAYRPRKAAGAGMRIFESAAASIILNPPAWTKHISEALDYQFGFEVSRSRLYLFLQKAVLPFLLCQIAVIYLFSCFVFIGPEEVGIIERFGRPRPSELGAGAHLKLPWPFEQVRKIAARRAHRLDIGFEAHGEHESARAILWSKPHYDREEYVLTAACGEEDRLETDESGARSVSAGLVVFNAPVEYVVTNAHAYLYNHRAPEELLRNIALRAIARKAAGRDLFSIVGAGLKAVLDELKAELQAEADALGLGVQVLFVGAGGIHPPVPVAGAFEAAGGALEEKAGRITQARGFATAEIPRASARARAAVLAAEAGRASRTKLAAAEAELFAGVNAAYGGAPAVFKRLRLLESVEKLGRLRRKYIIAVEPRTEVLTLNYEKRLSAELLELESLSKEKEAGDRQ